VSFSGEIVDLGCKRTPPQSLSRRAQCLGVVDCSILMSAPSSSPTPVTILQLRRTLLSLLFLPGQRWAHHGVRLIVSFSFCRSIYIFVVIPIQSMLPSFPLHCRLVRPTTEPRAADHLQVWRQGRPPDCLRKSPSPGAT
jgi:hypothetical protein